MIMICERCFAEIGAGEPLLRLAHLHEAHPDGSITWVHTFVHTQACVAVRTADHERPDTGAWNPARGIGTHRN
ncbi:hypothetical protein [Pseudonocardia sp. GCM10023141]|uniref:hypothetical protein n=1 Tax=Pseudonocardia sp. GCM10023141 TaxID=3252653 RepID=UPI00361E34AE